MKNKEIKKGSKIWIYSPFLSRKESYTVISVKKTGTLVTVVILCERYSNSTTYQMTLYGHASSSMLSGYDRTYNFGMEGYYTCDYSLIERWTKDRESKLELEEIGRNLKLLLNSLKI